MKRVYLKRQPEMGWVDEVGKPPDECNVEVLTSGQKGKVHMEMRKPVLNGVQLLEKADHTMGQVRVEFTNQLDPDTMKKEVWVNKPSGLWVLHEAYTITFGDV